MKKFSNIESRINKDCTSSRPGTALSMKSKITTKDSNHIAFGRSSTNFLEKEKH